MSDETGLSIVRSTPEPCPNDFNASQYILQAGLKTPEKPALEVYDTHATLMKTWTHAALRTAVNKAAGALVEHGIKPKDRILFRLSNIPEFPIAYLACIQIGALPVPTSSLLTTSEVDYIAQDLEPTAVLHSDGITLPTNARVIPVTDLDGPELSDFAMTQCNDPAYIVYTSGTSGKPRAVVHAHRAVWARRMMWADWYDLKPTDRMLHAGAFNWTYTLGTGLIDPWTIGATAMICADAIDRTIWARLAEQHKPTIFAAAPGVFRQILDAPVGQCFKSLRHAISAGEKLPSTTRKEWIKETGTQVYEALGMTEVSTFVSQNPRVSTTDSHSGAPQKGRTIAVLDDQGNPTPFNQAGELAVHRNDTGLFLEYLNQPKETKASFSGDWFKTGDMVSMTDTHEIRYLGRTDDMLNAGGIRVSPIEIETVLLNLPLIIEAAAIEVSVRTDVTVIGLAYVSTKDIPQEVLQAHCATHLAPYKCPRVFHRLDTLPKSPNGKIKRAAVKDML